MIDLKDYQTSCVSIFMAFCPNWNKAYCFRCFHCFARAALIGYNVIITWMDQNKTEVYRRVCTEKNNISWQTSCAEKAGRSCWITQHFRKSKFKVTFASLSLTFWAIFIEFNSSIVFKFNRVLVLSQNFKSYRSVLAVLFLNIVNICCRLGETNIFYFKVTITSCGSEIFNAVELKYREPGTVQWTQTKLRRPQAKTHALNLPRRDQVLIPTDRFTRQDRCRNSVPKKEESMFYKLKNSMGDGLDRIPSRWLEKHWKSLTNFERSAICSTQTMKFLRQLWKVHSAIGGARLGE